MLFGENSKWRKICLDPNGRGLYGKMCHESRIPGKNIFFILGPTVGELWGER